MGVTMGVWCMGEWLDTVEMYNLVYINWYSQFVTVKVTGTVGGGNI